MDKSTKKPYVIYSILDDRCGCKVYSITHALITATFTQRGSVAGKPLYISDDNSYTIAYCNWQRRWFVLGFNGLDSVDQHKDLDKDCPADSVWQYRGLVLNCKSITFIIQIINFTLIKVLKQRSKAQLLKTIDVAYLRPVLRKQLPVCYCCAFTTKQKIDFRQNSKSKNARISVIFKLETSV